jgi:nitroreductase
MKDPLDKDVLARLFIDARTPNAFLPHEIKRELLEQLYELARMGPTSMNCQPMRLVFLVGREHRDRLLPTLLPGNVKRTAQAPVTVLVAFDNQFHNELPDIWHRPEAKTMFAANPELAQSTAKLNASIQGGYLILAARALGLDCGPMSGFDPVKVNAEFFPDGRCSVNFICNLGYGDDTALFHRNRRLSFDEACRVL